MESKVVSATEFKAKCLSLIKQMEEDGNAITITSLAVRTDLDLCQVLIRVLLRVVVPVPQLHDAQRGKIKIVGDIVNYSMWDPIGK